MQLSEPKALGTFDDHHRCVRDVYADFDDGCRNHDVTRSIRKSLHFHVFGLWLHSTVENTDAEIRKRESPR